MRKVLALAALALAGLGIAADKSPARHALLIVNTRYSSLPELTGAPAAAQQLRQALQEEGFDVTYKENAPYADLVAAAPEFLKSVRPGDVALFYFAGYSTFIEDDDNYLLPVDFAPSATGDLQDRALRLKVVEHAFGRADKPGLKLYVIEAARQIDVPLAAVNGSVPEPGLMAPDMDPGLTPESLFLMPAAARRPVSGEFGLMTRALAREIQKPDSRLQDVLARTKRDVFADSGGKQVLSVLDGTLDDFRFHAAPPAPAPRETAAAPPPKPQGRQPGDVAQSSIDGESYVWVPAGHFQMGCVPSDIECDADEKPRHEVELTHGFWLGQTETPVLAYTKFVDSFRPVMVGGQKIKARNHEHMPHGPSYDPQWLQSLNPIVNVNWRDAQRYCGWARGRLPTEAEWEYAGRAGKPDTIRVTAAQKNQPILTSLAAPDSGKPAGVQRVRDSAANAWNLYGMSGNVWEWVFDFYSADYYAASPAADPRGPESGHDHVTRGGPNARLSARRARDGSDESTGFRCVLDDNPQTNSLLGVK